MQRIACVASFFVANAVLVGCASAPAYARPQIDGLYVMSEEVRGYQDDRLELRNGRFRYWHSGDVIVVDERGRNLDKTKYPIRGTFKVDGSRITFSSEDVDARYIDTINGHSVLWTLDSKRIWDRQHKIYDYGVLIRVASHGSDADSPSIRVLYDARMRKRIKEWRDPFVHGRQ
jgi:hypothetical protein